MDPSLRTARLKRSARLARPVPRSRLLLATGVASLVAAAAHGALAPAHLQEWWGYGVVFLAAALAQAVLGLALAMDALPERRHLRAALLASAALDAALLALYAWTRTVGIPLLGPAAGEVEGVAPIDVLTKLAEAFALVGALLAWRRA